MDLGSRRRSHDDGNAIFHSTTEWATARLLIESLRAGNRAVVLTGADGLGKTAALNMVLARLGPAGPRVLWLEPPFPSPLGVQQRLAALLGEPGSVVESPADLARSIAALRAPAPGAAALLIVVDGAEAVPVPLLHYLGLMQDLACRDQPTLQLVLAGREALWWRLADERLESLRRGVAARIEMQPISEPESTGFLRYLLSGRGRWAEPAAVAEMLRVGGGVPGRLVMLLDAACAGLPPRSMVTVQRVRTVLGVASGPTTRRRVAAWLPRLLAGLPGLLSWHGAIAAIALGLVVGVSQVLGLGAPPQPRRAELSPDPAAAATPMPNPPVLTIPARHGGEKNATTAPSQPAGPPATEVVDAHEASQRPEAPDFAALQAQLGSAVEMAKGLAAQAGDMMARADINLASLVPSLPAVPASPAPVIPPAAVGIHVQAEYPALDQVAEARARWAVGVLRAAGFEVSDPVAISRRTVHPGVRYFSRSDRDAAKAVAHALEAAGRPVYLRQLHQRSDARPPGMIEVLFATR